MRILQIAQSEKGGGASRVVFDLHRSYLEAGHDARLLVKFPAGSTPGVIGADAFCGISFCNPICAALDRIVGGLKYFRGQRFLRECLWKLAYPKRFLDKKRGIEDFNYPYSYRLLDDSLWVPEVVHVHNMSTNFFDLRALIPLSQRIPVFITLHDAWMFTGHCAHPMDCSRWLSGCGECPDLLRYPSIRKDKTHENWLLKKDIYARSRLHVAAVSNWLKELASRSILRTDDLRVIYNGIDLDVFCPGNKKKIRDALNLPQDAFICLFVTKTGARRDSYKDYSTVKNAVDEIENRSLIKDVFFVCIGGRRSDRGSTRRKFVSYLQDPKELARYYQAADVFLHAASAESFGLTLVEAQACGISVIATDVCGISETMRVGETGILVPRGGSAEMAKAIIRLFGNRDKSREMGEAAEAWAKERFDLRRQAQEYLSWYKDILKEYRDI